MCYIGGWNCSCETEETVINQEAIGDRRYTWKIMGYGK